MNRGFGKGKSAKRFSFTYNHLAEALGMSVGAVKKHAQRGNFNPQNLLSVLEFINRKLHNKE